MEYAHYMYLRGPIHEDQPLPWLAEDRKGMTITSGSVTFNKDGSNLIGISIGGGSPYCPCLYVVQVFDNTPASRDGSLQPGDEIVSINGHSCKGCTKLEVAKRIQTSKDVVTIGYNKLHADPKKGKTLDVVLKKLKHQIVENMSNSTADALGLSRAILCNDSLVKKLEELNRIEDLYSMLIDHTKRVLRGYLEMMITYKDFGDLFCSMGVRECEENACKAFGQFGEYHRQMEKLGIKMLKATHPILRDLHTYLTKAIPDTKLTIKKYADVKFEYLSYCLKVKEMDDEEASCAAVGDLLSRVETGNYEYRLILRCRFEARRRFSKWRSDVLVKMELLDNKHVQDLVYQLKRLMSGLSECYLSCHDLMKDARLFPIEMSLKTDTFYSYSSMSVSNCDDEDEQQPEGGKEEADVPLLDCGPDNTSQDLQACLMHQNDLLDENLAETQRLLSLD